MFESVVGCLKMLWLSDRALYISLECCRSSEVDHFRVFLGVYCRLFESSVGCCRLSQSVVDYFRVFLGVRCRLSESAIECLMVSLSE